MQISVVIPTCNRKPGLLSLLNDLDRSLCPLAEVIIVDSGEDRLTPADYSLFTNLNIHYMSSERSVCIQRNTGIAVASSSWIFLCDDDVEMPADYLLKLTAHLQNHPAAGAVCGLFLQKEEGQWQGAYPVRSTGLLRWKYIFGLGIWGEIQCKDHPLIRKIKDYYRRKGNHIARSGWPVLTDFSGDYTTSPIYTLGAAMVKRDWLLHSPFDEVLDSHGIGDNYGVCLGFPGDGIHILTDAFVYHHRSAANRLQRPLQYLRRVLAIDYFIGRKEKLQHCRRSLLLWSLTGNLLAFIRAGDRMMIRPAGKAIRLIATGRNPYTKAANQ